MKKVFQLRVASRSVLCFVALSCALGLIDGGENVCFGQACVSILEKDVRSAYSELAGGSTLSGLQKSVCGLPAEDSVKGQSSAIIARLVQWRTASPDQVAGLSKAYCGQNVGTLSSSDERIILKRLASEGALWDWAKCERSSPHPPSKTHFIADLAPDGEQSFVIKARVIPGAESNILLNDVFASGARCSFASLAVGKAVTSEWVSDKCARDANGKTIVSLDSTGAGQVVVLTVDGKSVQSNRESCEAGIAPDSCERFGWEMSDECFSADDYLGCRQGANCWLNRGRAESLVSLSCGTDPNSEPCQLAKKTIGNFPKCAVAQ